jgi:hypothetical protein
VVRPSRRAKNLDQHSQLIFPKQHFVGPFHTATPHLSVESKFEFDIGGLLAPQAGARVLVSKKQPCVTAGTAYKELL